MVLGATAIHRVCTAELAQLPKLKKIKVMLAAVFEVKLDHVTLAGVHQVDYDVLLLLLLFYEYRYCLFHSTVGSMSLSCEYVCS